MNTDPSADLTTLCLPLNMAANRLGSGAPRKVPTVVVHLVQDTICSLSGAVSVTIPRRKDATP